MSPPSASRLPFSGKTVVGMVHVRALPGTPYHDAAVPQIAALAADEARQWADAGCDALIVENMHDRPYLNGRVGPEIVAGMTAAVEAVRRAVDLPIGVQILAAANHEALAVARICGAQFIRAENFVYAHVADEGLMPEAAAAPLLRYRRAVGATEIAIIADIQKKHASHAITADVSLVDTARAAAFFGADGVVVTGLATGHAACPEDVRALADSRILPVAVGSGLNADNLAAFWPHADLFIIGSTVKRDGVWSNPIEPQRLQTLMASVRQLRAQ